MKKDSVVLYEKPTCTKCRQANKLLSEKNVDFRKVNYYETPFTAAEMRRLLKKMGLKAKDILRDGEPVYRELGLAKRKDELSEDELIDLMVAHPDLIQRPIVERGDSAVLGRPTENIEKLWG